MRKEQFKKMVKDKDYQLEWFYHYYTEKTGINMNIHLFKEWFEQLNLDTVLDHVAKQYGLTRLLTNDGVMVAVYEPT